MRWPWTSSLRRLFRAPRPTARRPASFRPRLDVLEERCLLTAYVVTTTKDLLNDTTQGELTLRDALTAISTQAASGNAPAGGATNSVSFSIGSAGSVQTINLTSALPAVTHQVTLNGLTNGGTGGTTPLIVLNGSTAGATTDGLTLQAGSDGSTVEGLVLQQFGGNGLVLNGTSNNTVASNFIGTDFNGTAKVANLGIGILIEGGAKSNTVGGTTATAANVISGNAFGLDITGAGTSSNVIEGNIFGLAKDGTTALGNTNPNTSADVVIQGGATLNIIGGTTAGVANTLAASGAGVYIVQTGTSQNLVAGNFIGTDKTGNQQHGNGIGVVIGVGANANTVGGTTATAANVISGNFYGVDLSDSGSNNNTVQGNLIGTNAAGSAALPNSIGIVVAFGSSGNAIGGAPGGAGNLLSANTYGLVLAGAGTANNVVSGNLVGTEKTGTANLANSGVGMLIETGATANLIGGTTAGAGNVIDFNQVGVFLDGGTTSGNAIQGNLIGTDITKTAAAGNVVGVQIQNGAHSNTVGGTAAGAGNTIAFNVHQGVIVGNSPADTSTVGDAVLGNSIFGNGALGIDLGADGPTANGANPRSFPNDGQNFPTITASGGNTVSASLTSVPGKSFIIQYFGSPSSPTGQGKTFLGSDTVTTDATGNVSFMSNLASPIPAGDVLTATATNQSNFDTSEFSR